MRNVLITLSLLLCTQTSWAQQSFTDHIVGYSINLPDDWDLHIVKEPGATLQNTTPSFYSATHPQQKTNLNTSHTITKQALITNSDIVIFRKVDHGSVELTTGTSAFLQNTEEQYCEQLIGSKIKTLGFDGIVLKLSEKQYETISGKRLVRYDCSYTMDGADWSNGIIYYWAKDEKIFLANITYVDKDTKNELVDAFATALSTF